MLAKAGNAVFDNLPLLFAVGVAIGFARKSDGSTGLAAVVGYLVFDAVYTAVAGQKGYPVNGETVSMGVLSGILIGITPRCSTSASTASSCPSYLAFFGGRRFVPIVTGFGRAARRVFGLHLADRRPGFNASATGSSSTTRSAPACTA